jgi:serine phosphatase RsbU (regulator of sigma subunit)
MASLLLLCGPRQGELVPLHREHILLGRGAECDVVIDETMFRATARRESVSRKHAVISRVGAHFYIEDGDGQGRPSRNGTFINDQRLTGSGRALLRHNDRIRICDFDCAFHEKEVASVEVAIDHESSTRSLQAQPAERLRVILDISNSLSTTLELDALLPQIIDSLLSVFRQADRGLILLREGPTASLEVRACKTRRPGDESGPRFSASIVQRCLEKVEAILGNDLAQQFPDSESVMALPVRSLMCAPLWSQTGQALGAIQLDAQGAKSKFTQDDLNLLLGVASQASIALCNARLHRELLARHQRERDLEVAHHVQMALLPQGLPDLPGYQFFAHYQSALEVGGDYYDFIPLPGGRLAVLLGDVAGKGVPAALVMAKFSVEARVSLQSEPDLSAAVNRLNALLTRAPVSDRFVTLAAVVLDPAAHTLTLVNAGHPSPLLVRRATGAVEEAAPADLTGPPVGVRDGIAYASRALSLQPGDALVLFSDGVPDALCPLERPLGLKGTRSVLEGGPFTPAEAGEHLVQAVKHHAAGRPQNDDVTVVCFGRAFPSP